MGLRPEHTGTIKVEGNILNIKDISSQINSGFALVPEDRQREGLVQTLDIGRNISLSVVKRLRKYGFIDLKKNRRLYTGRFRISGLRFQTEICLFSLFQEAISKR